eukprot:5223069-Prymnesium_polylepis.1
MGADAPCGALSPSTLCYPSALSPQALPQPPHPLPCAAATLPLRRGATLPLRRGAGALNAPQGAHRALLPRRRAAVA